MVKNHRLGYQHQIRLRIQLGAANYKATMMSNLECGIMASNLQSAITTSVYRLPVRTPPFERWIGELRQKPILLGALLGLTTLFLYAPIAHYDFIGFDDSAYVVDNIHVHNGLNLTATVWAFTTFYKANWHPITWLSHAVDCQVFGLNSGAHHRVNLVLHVFNALLLFTLLRLGTGAVWRSFLVAILFAVHPVNVETVAWVAERKSLLCTLLSFLTIAAYGWYIRRPNWKKYVTIVVAFSLALMSKPMAVTVPLALLLLDYWPLKREEDVPLLRRWGTLLTEKFPLILMSGASSYVTIVAQRSGGAAEETFILPFFLRLENAVVSYVAYIGKLFWPAKLAVFYPLPQQFLPWHRVAGSILILIAITMAAIYFHYARYFVVGWCLFLTTLIPVIGIVQVGRQAMADRYAYVPYIGLFIVVAWSLNDLTSIVPAFARFMPAVAAVSLVVAYSAATAHYLRYWQNEVTLFTQARNVSPQPDFLIEGALSDGLRTAGRTDEALEHSRIACALEPSDPGCHYQIAHTLFDKNEFDQAIAECHTVARLTRAQTIPLSVSCLVKSGAVLMDLGQFDAAGKEFESALAFDPHDPTALHFREVNLCLIRGGSR